MNRKIIVLLMLLICALSVSTVSAEDGDAVSANFTDLQATIDDGGDSVDLTSDYAKNTSESYVTISKNMTINGNNHVIDGSKGNAFVIGANSSVTINDLTFINSVRPVFNYGNVILNNCTFIDNNGAVSSSSGSTLEVRDCRFINNTRTAQYAMGGAISATGATVKISGSSFINVLKSAYRIETGDVVKYFNNGTQYTVTVRDLQDNPVEGKTVSVTVNSAKWNTPVTYNITTDEKGTATLPIGLVAGEYTISANVDGNIAENSITVLPVLTTESISKPVNQPASLLAKLVDGQGNPASGKTVTFTVKTKSYDRSTDENGIAALPIGLGIGKWTIMVSDPETGAKTSATVTVTKAIT